MLYCTYKLPSGNSNISVMNYVYKLTVGMKFGTKLNTRRIRFYIPITFN